MVAVGLVLLLGQACEKVTLEAGPVPEVVSFSDHVVPIFSDKCVTCHNGGGLDLDLRPDEAYQSLQDENLIGSGSPDNSPLYKKLEGGHGNANATDLAIIYRWLEQGAKDN